jgi:vitamin B12 transporter
MRPMDWHRPIPLILGFCIILFIIVPCSLATAQTQEEMTVLALFYEEKDLVVTPTRHPKPVSQVAENITVITAKEIQAMNAHTIAEVLNRVSGLFVSFSQDFGAASLLHAQGSEPRHVLVLLDGVPWTSLSEGSAETNSIPVGIIDRIEIIKGPASSAWGSSLGGVVNILTRPAGDMERHAGSVRASYGKSDTQDHRAQISGRAGPVGYYAYAGRQKSDGLRDSRYFDTYGLYAKCSLAISDYVEAGLSMGYSDPHLKAGDFPDYDITQTVGIRAFFTIASLEAFPAKGIGFHLSVHKFAQESIVMTDALGLGIIGPPGELYLETVADEEITGGRGKLVWEKGRHTAVFGVDFDQGRLDGILDAGPYLQSLGAPVTSASHTRIDRWAVYANDTLTIGRWSITPGIRYDHDSITGSFISPSLGLTRELGKETVFRASVARGFTSPPLLSASTGGLFLDPNPALEPEEVWSFQAGIESGALQYLWAKATLFRHDLDKGMTRAPYAGGPPAFNDLVINHGKSRRQGLELEARTLPVHHLSVLAGVSYVDISPADDEGAEHIYVYAIGLEYDNRNGFRAELFGRYTWWDTDPDLNGSYDEFIWDLNLNKNVFSGKTTRAEIFLTAHNLFNGTQYPAGEYKNPETWVEAGIRFRF